MTSFVLGDSSSSSKRSCFILGTSRSRRVSPILCGRGISRRRIKFICVFSLHYFGEWAPHMGAAKISAGGKDFFPQGGGLQKMT